MKTSKNTTSKTEAVNKKNTVNTGEKGDSKGSEANSGVEMITVSSAEHTPLGKLFLGLLQDTYWAEQHLLQAIPEMSNAATTDMLKAAFDDHHSQTKTQVQRLEKIFEIMNVPAEAKKCPVMEALVKEGKRGVSETPENTMTRDAGLIISAQKIEHYEIAAYGSLVQLALTLEEEEIAYLLEKTLSEEEDTDMLLTDIAEMHINPRADREESDNENEESNQEEKKDYPDIE